jgi:hypothetical protein
MIEQFLKDRLYLTNCTAKTVEWYRGCLKHLPNDNPSQADINAVVIRLREKGNSPAGVNSVIRAVNAYCKWLSLFFSKLTTMFVGNIPSSSIYWRILLSRPLLIIR